jgi:hypothetical protein
LRRVRAYHFYGRRDLRLLGEAIHVAKSKEDVDEFPWFVAEVFRMSGIEVSDGEEELS